MTGSHSIMRPPSQFTTLFLISRPLHRRGCHRLFATAANRVEKLRSGQGCQAVNLATTRPDLDFDFLLCPTNLELLERNCRQRKSPGNIRNLHATWAELQKFAPFGAEQAPSQAHLRTLWDRLYAEAVQLPNVSDAAAPIGDEIQAKLVEHIGGEKREEEGILTAEQLVGGWGVLRWPNRTGASGRSYALLGTLADLERVLLDYAFDFLHARLKQEPGINGVEVLQVDDILPVSTTRSCGVQQGLSQQPLQYRVFHSHQVFGRDEENSGIVEVDFSDSLPGALCLSGTAEMGIAQRIKGRIFDESQLPLYFLAESTSFRPETTGGPLEGGIYRVHEFKKIEMFVVCTERQSAAELQRLVNIQKELLASLQIHCRILDMPTEELGPPAARKFDIEAWMPGRKAWGELTSASNCTDYQARRLHIRYRPNEFNDGASQSGPLHYAHTCNGTGLASTRTLIALLETCQLRAKQLDLPAVIKERMPAGRSPILKGGPALPIKYRFDSS